MRVFPSFAILLLAIVSLCALASAVRFRDDSGSSSHSSSSSSSSSVVIDSVDDRRFGGGVVETKKQVDVVNANYYPPPLSVSPEKIPSTGSNVTVRWTGVSNPTHLDYIAVYSPPDSPDMDMIALVHCGPEGRESGEVTFPVVHLFGAGGYQFRYWNGGSPRGPKKTKVVAVSRNVQFEDENEAAEGHIALADSPGIATVMWSSGDKNPGEVRFGLSANDLSFTVPSVAKTYSATDMCASPANETWGFRWPGYIHTAVITAPTGSTAFYPGRKVYYTYGSTDGMGVSRSQVRSFAVLAAPGSKGVSSIIYGDQGVSFKYGGRGVQKVYEAAGESAEYVGAAIARNEASLVLLIGDISYARGYGFQWSQFFDEMKEVVHAVPLQVAVGNHEYDHLAQKFRPSWSNYGSDSGGECGVPYAMRFSTPGMGKKVGNLYYSFDHGLVHHVVSSSETDFLPGSPQYEFIANDLASVNKSVTPFIAFSTHRPFYTSFYHVAEDGLMARLRETYEPLFIKFGVDVVFCGHVHSYERMSRIVNGTINESGPVHILVGGGGNNDQVTENNPQPAWSRVRSYDYGFGRLTAYNAESLFFEYVTDKTGRVMDSFWIRGSLDSI